MDITNDASIAGPKQSAAAMPLYVPSSHRSDVHAGTLSKILTGGGVYLVVQDGQARNYEPLADQFNVEMLVLPKGIERIAPTRKWIAEHAACNGYAKHCQIDDDLYFYQRFGSAFDAANCLASIVLGLPYGLVHVALESGAVHRVFGLG